jgi:NAD(P)H-hydrate epimerase
MHIPTLHWNDLPKVSAAQMAHLLMLATGKYGLDARVLSEHIGRSLADLCQHLVPDGPVLVVAGRGSNGGAGLSAARLLAAHGRPVWVVPIHEAENYSGVPKEQLAALKYYPSVRVKSSIPKMKFACAIDAAIGTNLEGPPRGRTLDALTVLNAMETCTVVALDVPTGLVADDGTTPGHVVQADATLCIGLLKPGLQHPAVGDLYLADAGFPPLLLSDIGLMPLTLPAWICRVER